MLSCLIDFVFLGSQKTAVKNNQLLQNLNMMLKYTVLLYSYFFLNSHFIVHSLFLQTRIKIIMYDCQVLVKIRDIGNNVIKHENGQEQKVPQNEHNCDTSLWITYTNRCAVSNKVIKCSVMNYRTVI